MNILGDISGALLTAVLLPLGLLASLLIVRVLVAAHYRIQRSKLLPIVIHPLTFEHNLPQFVGSQSNALLEVPSRVRDYISDDPIGRPSLAPGPVSPIAPAVSVAAPSSSDSPSWASLLLELVFPQTRAAYNLIMIPEVPHNGHALGAQIVRTPGHRLIAARSFKADSLSDLVAQVGAFCVENVLEQPARLRRTPRWEHWNEGAYLAYRRALSSLADNDTDAAHALFGDAALLAPGNTRVALHHGGMHEAAKEFREAAATYNAACCLWPHNVDLSFRLASATVNHVLHNLSNEPRAEELVRAANATLRLALRRMGLWHVLRRCLSATFNPRRRDLGERRYWFSWLRPDPHRAPLRLLRRTRGHEYRSALRVSIEATELLLHLLPATPGHPRRGSIDRSMRRVLRVVGKRRSGWLAHWSAACYFSRAIELLPEHRSGVHQSGVP